jgi:hypothetical protein
LANALTPAQRAKRYRDRQRELKESKPNKSDVTKNLHLSKRDVTEKELPSYGLLESRIVLLNAENMRLSQDLEAATQQIADLSGLLQMFIDAWMNKRSIPADVFRNICQSLLKLNTRQTKR